MTIDTAKELQMNIAKEGLALLVLHPTADVQLHRECISHIGTAWDIPFGDTQEVISLLDRELDAIHAAEKNGTVTHVLPEEELPMNASGLETLDNIWDLFETSLRVDSPYARTRLFEMAKWLEESQNLLDWIEKTMAGCPHRIACWTTSFVSVRASILLIFVWRCSSTRFSGAVSCRSVCSASWMW